MVIPIGNTDVFEQGYAKKFQLLAIRHGQLVGHEYDRSGLDLGLQLTDSTDEGTFVTSTKVWFQLKGFMAGTLPAEKYDASSDITIPLSVEQLRYWHKFPEAVYVVVYIESKDLFLAVDVRDLVDEGTLKSLPTTQQKLTVHIPKTRLVNDAFWERLRTHESMRIDRQSYKGNPLPHDRDVVTDVLLKLDPTVFEKLVEGLLAQHTYTVTETLDSQSLFACSGTTDRISVTVGKLPSAFEWIPRLTAEFIPDEDGLRYEGQVLRTYGKCAVLIHSQVAQGPQVAELQQLASILQERGTKQLLVFVNAFSPLFDSFNRSTGEQSYNCYPLYREGISAGTGIDCFPAYRDDISFKVLTTGKVYKALADDLHWLSDLARQKFKSGEWRVI